MYKISFLIIFILLFGCDENFEDGQINTDTDTNFEDIICDNPPDAKCTEDGDLISYTGEATCIYGECYYSYKIIFCENDCDNSNGDYECTDPCDGIVCDDPPDGFCTITSIEGEDEYHTYYNHRAGHCQVNEDSSFQCNYLHTSGSLCGVTSHCEVIDGIAGCVEN